MSLNDLAPAKPKRAHEKASRTFLKFLEEEGVSWKYLELCMTRENAALALEVVVDKFGLYLAFKEGRQGKLLARHSVMRYFRQAKNWLLEQFPQYRATVEKSLLKKGQVLERHCMKHESEAFVNKAPACTKVDLKKMMEYLYSTAVTAADYQDAALLCLLWFLFWRASDLTLLRNANLSISSGNIFFIRFIRIKTSKEQGLSLFPDDDFMTCPLLAIVLALVVQSSPTLALLGQLPVQPSVSATSLAPGTPLIDLLDHPEDVLPSQETPNATVQTKGPDAAPGVHSYVNRVLDRVAKRAGVTKRLTSHSFWRGGAQHANEAGLCVQWIFDGGAWNMTATNKDFAYVFNTPSEDHKVARVLSGRDTDRTVPLMSLEVFDSNTQAKIRDVAATLFNASYGLNTAQYNVNGKVIDTLVAYLLRHYPSLKRLNADGLAVKRLEECVSSKGHSLSELLAWSSHLSRQELTSPQSTITKTQGNTSEITKHPMFLHQSALIEQLIDVNRKLDARMASMEAQVYNKPLPTTNTREDNVDDSASKKRRTGAATNLMDAWFLWYAQEPRIWSSTDSATKHTRSTGKQVVLAGSAPRMIIVNDAYQQNRNEYDCS